MVHRDYKMDYCSKFIAKQCKALDARYAIDNAFGNSICD
jgi:hypothetical protein